MIYINFQNNQELINKKSILKEKELNLDNGLKDYLLNATDSLLQINISEDTLSTENVEINIDTEINVNNLNLKEIEIKNGNGKYFFKKGFLLNKTVANLLNLNFNESTQAENVEINIDNKRKKHNK